MTSACRIFFYVICSLQCIAAIAQDNPCACPSDTCQVVVARSGIKLRERPDLQAKALMVIPFGAKVYPASSPKSDDPGIRFTDADGIMGNWARIRYNGKTGYVCNAYLGHCIYKMEDNAYLFLEKISCGGRPYYSDEYTYYGLFLRNQKKQLFLQKIRPVFYMERFKSGNSTAASIKAQGPERPFLILACRTPLAGEGLIKNQQLFGRDFNFAPGATLLENDSVRYTVQVPHSSWELTCQKQASNPKKIRGNLPHPGWKNVIQLKDIETGAVQIIREDIDTAGLLWCGDLDRDGRQDFLILSSTDMAPCWLLYLSGGAGDGKLVRMARGVWDLGCD
jgi:hypothetical protein